MRHPATGRVVRRRDSGRDRLLEEVHRRHQQERVDVHPDDHELVVELSGSWLRERLGADRIHGHRLRFDRRRGRHKDVEHANPLCGRPDDLSAQSGAELGKPPEAGEVRRRRLHGGGALHAGLVHLEGARQGIERLSRQRQRLHDQRLAADDHHDKWPARPLLVLADRTAGRRCGIPGHGQGLRRLRDPEGRLRGRSAPGWAGQRAHRPGTGVRRSRLQRRVGDGDRDRLPRRGWTRC